VPGYPVTSLRGDRLAFALRAQDNDIWLVDGL
jgi:hypothetical protein